MKKLLLIVFNAILMCLCFIPNLIVANAANALSLTFALTSNNQSVVYAQKGQEIEVSFELKRTDSNANYTLTSFENWIHYDRDFFEFVEGSIVREDTGTNVSWNDNLTYGKIVQCSNMSLSGKTYASPTTICTFKLKVLADNGSGMVYNGGDNEALANDANFMEVAITKQDLQVFVTDCAHLNKTVIPAKAPTCTEIGWDEYEICSLCDYTTYKEKAALGHNKISHKAKTPTCTEIGWDAYETCSRCDYTTYVEKAALGHLKSYHQAKAPTCTEVGWNAYESCSRCPYTTYVEKAALDHDKEFHEAVAATCTDDGCAAYYSCNTCGWLFDETGNQISKVPYIVGGHNFPTEAAFDENGHWYACTRCGEISGYALHSGKKADCNSKAKCDVCGQEYGDVDPHHHTGETYLKDAKDPWPWRDGYTGDVYCSDCDELVQEGETISRTNVTAWPLRVILVCFFVLLFIVLILALLFCIVV